MQRPHTYAQYEKTDAHTVAALLMDSLGRNHGFNDGNKRTALMAAIYTYAINEVYLSFNQATNDDFEELVLWVVKSKPSITEIRTRLMLLVENHKVGSFELFLQSFKSFFS